MFSINGFNYVIDTNRVPHAIVGNDNVSPLATDVTVQSGHARSQLDLHAQRADLRVHRGFAHNLLTITGTKSYMIASRR